MRRKSRWTEAIAVMVLAAVMITVFILAAQNAPAHPAQTEIAGVSLFAISLLVVVWFLRRRLSSRREHTTEITIGVIRVINILDGRSRREQGLKKRKKARGKHDPSS